jgi:hypothetical protein
MGSFCWRTVSNTRKEKEGRLASFVTEDEASFVLSYSPTGAWLQAKDGPVTKPKRIIDRNEFSVTVTPTFRVVGGFRMAPSSTRPICSAILWQHFKKILGLYIGRISHPVIFTCLAC